MFGHETLSYNPLQRETIKYVEDDCNLIVLAPTSSGKTVVAEQFIQPTIEKGEKAIYLSPLKALTQEKLDDWSSKVASITAITGDHVHVTKAVQQNLVLMTTEALDSKTRGDQAWLYKVGTIVSDESHLLASVGRGDAFEVGLTRFSLMNPDARIIFLSATIPNTKVLADWLTRLNGKPTKVVETDWRPVKQEHHLKSLSGNYYFFLEEAMCRINEILKRHKTSQVLIFVHTINHGLKISQRFKIPFHYSKVGMDERHRIESGYRKGSIRRLVATSTLCMHPKTKIITKDNVKFIKDIVPGDLVYTHKGDWQSVKDIIPSKTNNLLKFQIYGCVPIYLTEDHRIRVRERKPYYVEGKRNWKYEEPEWKTAREIEISNKTYYVEIPLPKSRTYIHLDIYDNCKKVANQYGKTNYDHPRSNRTYKQVLLDEDVSYFIGAWIAEGSAGNRGQIILDIAGKEGSFALNWSSVIRKFVKDCEHRVTNPMQNKMRVSFNSKPLSLWLKNNCGTNAHNKKFPDEIFYNENLSVVEKGLKGLLEGDGCLVKSKNRSYTISLTTVSYYLAWQVQIMLARLGYNSSIKENVKKYKEGMLGKAGDIWYQVTITGTSVYEAARIFFGKELSMGNRTYNLGVIKNNCLLKRIKNIENYDYEGPVYNIAVENDYSYNAGFSVHNSYGMNLPADVGVIVGNRRGPMPVSPADIKQEAGRIGRYGLSENGVVYYLFPEDNAEEVYDQVLNTPNIESVLPSRLYFHVCSFVAREGMQRGEINDFLSKTLGAEQFNLKVNDAIETLKDYDALVEDNGGLRATKIGRASALMYLDPIDLYYWRENFMGKPMTPTAIAKAFADIPSNHIHTFVPKSLDNPIDLAYGQASLIATCVRDWIGGRPMEGMLYSIIPPIIKDIDRIVSGMKLAGLHKAYVDNFYMMIKHGVDDRLLELISINGIGRKRAKALAHKNIRTKKEIVDNEVVSRNILGPKLYNAIKESITAPGKIRLIF